MLPSPTSKIYKWAFLSLLTIWLFCLLLAFLQLRGLFSDHAKHFFDAINNFELVRVRPSRYFESIISLPFFLLLRSFGQSLPPYFYLYVLQFSYFFFILTGFFTTYLFTKKQLSFFTNPFLLLYILTQTMTLSRVTGGSNLVLSFFWPLLALLLYPLKRPILQLLLMTLLLVAILFTHESCFPLLLTLPFVAFFQNSAHKFRYSYFFTFLSLLAIVCCTFFLYYYSDIKVISRKAFDLVLFDLHFPLLNAAVIMIVVLSLLFLNNQRKMFFAKYLNGLSWFITGSIFVLAIQITNNPTIGGLWIYSHVKSSAIFLSLVSTIIFTIHNFRNLSLKLLPITQRFLSPVLFILLVILIRHEFTIFSEWSLIKEKLTVPQKNCVFLNEEDTLFYEERGNNPIYTHHLSILLSNKWTPNFIIFAASIGEKNLPCNELLNVVHFFSKKPYWGRTYYMHSDMRLENVDFSRIRISPESLFNLQPILKAVYEKQK